MIRPVLDVSSGGGGQLKGASENALGVKVGGGHCLFPGGGDVTSICGQVRTNVPQNPECDQQVVPAASIRKMPIAAPVSVLLDGIRSIVLSVSASANTSPRRRAR